MRVVVMTQRRYGLAALALPLLAHDPDIELLGLVRPARAATSRRRRAWRALRKVARIGPLGALHGVRMRRWYGEDLRRELGLEPAAEVAGRLDVPVHEVEGTGSPDTVALLEGLAVDVLLSLGNGYIPRRVFGVPRYGAVNVHHELLPEFRGAQGVLWQLHAGSPVTGFTVHEIDDRIDTGRILHREEVPIVFGPTVRRTVVLTMAELYRRSALRLPALLGDLPARLEAARPQGPGRSFTTPGWGAWRRMVRNHRRLAREADRG